MVNSNALHHAQINSNQHPENDPIDFLVSDPIGRKTFRYKQGRFATLSRFRFAILCRFSGGRFVILGGFPGGRFIILSRFLIRNLRPIFRWAIRKIKPISIHNLKPIFGG